MYLKNIEISLTEGAEILKIKEESLKRLLKRKRINGEKDKDGRWHIYLFDVLFYKKYRGKSYEAPEGSLTVTETAKCLGIPREEVINKIREGMLKAIKIQGTWYIFRSSLIRALDKQIETLKAPDYIEEHYEKIKILCPYGISGGESVEIIRWLNAYKLHHMIVYKKDENDHEAHEIKNCLDLMGLQILKNEIISLKFGGLLAHVMMKEFKEMNTNLFRSHL